jgi:LysM repeat protein
VKRMSYFQFRVLILLAAAMLLLVACERPLQPGLEDAPVQPAPEVDPVLPVPLPIPPAPETGPETGEQPPVDETAPTEPTDEPPVGEEPPAATQPPTGETFPPGTEVTYVVQAGDTLGRIAERYGVSVEDIARANQIVNIDRLDVGQTLIIPVGGLPEQPPTTGETIHIVRAGDNLFRIGLQYGFTVDELVAYNNLANPNRLEVGQEIRIPPR